MKEKFNFAGIIISMIFFMGYQVPAAAEETTPGQARWPAPTVFQAEETVKLESTIVTATKTEKEVSGVTASVDVITSDEIKIMGASTLKDVIEKTPGLTIQYAGFPHPSSKSKSAISIRGMGGIGTLILIDGKRIAGETEQPYEMDRIPVDMIDRVEIVKGPMSTLYGSDALGGVINIITKKPIAGKVLLGMNLRGGMNDSGEGEEVTSSFNIRGQKRKFGYTFFVNYQRSDPYTEKDEYTTKALLPILNLPLPNEDQHGATGSMDVTYRDEAEVVNTGTSIYYNFTKAFKMGLDFNYLQEKREGFYIGMSQKPMPPGEFPPFAMILDTPTKSADDNKRLDYSAFLKYQFSDSLITRFRASRSEYKKRNRMGALNFIAPDIKKLSADVDYTEYSWESILSLTESHLLVGGVEYREISRASSVINPNPLTMEFIKKKDDFKAIYLQDEWQISDTINAILGIRHDLISYAKDETTVKMGLVKVFSPLFRLRLNYAEAYRAPDVAELYVIAPIPGEMFRLGADVVFGPKQHAHTLNPESLKSYEVGLGGGNHRFSYSTAIFYNDVKEKIELERVDIDNDNVDDYMTSVNKSHAATKGIEFDVEYHLRDGIVINLFWLELDTEDKQSNRELLFNPERMVSLGLDYQVNDKLSLSMLLRHTGEQFKSNSKKLADYTTTDISFRRILGTESGFEVYGGINNFFNAKVDRALGSNVGPFFYAGLRLNL